MNRKDPLIPGEYYHIYNRGNRKQEVFGDRADYFYFLRKLREQKQIHGVTIAAYCLMPNHYHLLLKQEPSLTCEHVKLGGGMNRISTMMQSIGTSIAKTFNKKYKTVGSLFQGTFQSKYISNDAYLIHLARYIHLNPVATGLVKRPEDWEYSSYLDIIGTRRGVLPDKNLILQYFNDNPDSYCEFVEAYKSEDIAIIGDFLFDD